MSPIKRLGALFLSAAALSACNSSRQDPGEEALRYVGECKTTPVNSDGQTIRVSQTSTTVLMTTDYDVEVSPLLMVQMSARFLINKKVFGDDGIKLLNTNFSKFCDEFQSWATLPDIESEKKEQHKQKGLVPIPNTPLKSVRRMDGMV